MLVLAMVVVAIVALCNHSQRNNNSCTLQQLHHATINPWGHRGHGLGMPLGGQLLVALALVAVALVATWWLSPWWQIALTSKYRTPGGMPDLVAMRMWHTCQVVPGEREMNSV